VEFSKAWGCRRPIILLQGPKTRQAIEKVSRLTAYYSDQKPASSREIRQGKLENHFCGNPKQRRSGKTANRIKGK
jgi:hypothetical protein